MLLCHDLSWLFPAAYEGSFLLVFKSNGSFLLNAVGRIFADFQHKTHDMVRVNAIAVLFLGVFCAANFLLLYIIHFHRFSIF